MTETPEAPVLYVIVCGAGPASDVGQLIGLAQRRGWDVQLIATPAALEFIDLPSLTAQSGHTIRSQYRRPGESRSPRADAIIVAPATYNTINKWAAGIADTYALGLLAEAPGIEVPTVVLPFVNSVLAGRQAFLRSVAQLNDEGVHILLGQGAFEPHAPGTGNSRVSSFPWSLALDEVDRVLTRPDSSKDD